MALMTGRVCLITGATSGIGHATAEALARLDAELILHGRDKARLDATLERIRDQTGNRKLSAVVADLASLDSVRGMANEIDASPRPLHVLINNAGVLSLSRRTTKDGFELMFGVNHLAHFLLTNLLWDKLRASAPARIVIVASRAHRGNRVDLDDLDSKRGMRGLSAYGRSKFANILFAKELARRLAGTRLVANALHPGLVATNMVSARRQPMSWLAAALRPLILTPEQGAKTSVYLASTPAAETVSGKYFMSCSEAAPDPATDNAELARALWEKSAALVGL